MINHILKVLLITVCLISLNINVFAESMDELLLNSIANNDIEMIKAALTNGADVNYSQQGQYTPLGLAVNNKNNNKLTTYQTGNNISIN